MSENYKLTTLTPFKYLLVEWGGRTTTAAYCLQKLRDERNDFPAPREEEQAHCGTIRRYSKDEISTYLCKHSRVIGPVPSEEEKHATIDVRKLPEVIALEQRLQEAQEEIKRLRVERDTALGEDKDGLLNKGEILALAEPLKPVRGVYFLIRLREIVYIGKSDHYWARTRQHKNDGKYFDAIAFIPFDGTDAELDTLEALYIRKFAPPLNGFFPPLVYQGVYMKGEFNNGRQLQELGEK